MRGAILGFGLALLLAGGASAENHALLIGVMGYPALRERDRLAGPGNDVALVRDYLLTGAPQPFAPRNIIVLLDGPGGGRPATAAAIRAAFADLATRVGPGDFVYLHFSGHGSQSPASPDAPEEEGAFDEIFLPYDVGPWDGAAGEVANALRDDEIGSMIAALTSRGAEVWAVFDTCHSATLTRAPLSDGVRLRRITPTDLGIPADLMTPPSAAGTDPGTASLPRGDPHLRGDGAAEVAPGPPEDPQDKPSPHDVAAIQALESAEPNASPAAAPRGRSIGQLPSRTGENVRPDRVQTRSASPAAASSAEDFGVPSGLPATAPGVPSTPPVDAVTTASVLPTDVVVPVPAGRLVAFFAAGTEESVPEMNLPPGAPDRRVQGLLTFAVVEAMRDDPTQSYAALAARVAARYRSLPSGPVAPVFEGQLDRPLFATAP